jgi:serine/threonine protein phosphatase PrpC
MIDDKEIFKIMKPPRPCGAPLQKGELDELCERLVQGALDAGGSDNISVIVIGWD